MSLPRIYANDDTYFRSAVGFLQKYSWIYREANTCFLKSFNDMPSDFKDYFLGISNEDLNEFPFVHEHLDGCPKEVERFREEIAKLTPTQTAPSAAPLPRNFSGNNCKMAAKKLHEIEQLAAHIHGHCADTPFIIDLGSGLGYLSEALLQRNDNYLILGLEADEQRVQAARQRSRTLLPQETHKSISYQQLFITADASSCARIEHYASELAAGNGLPRAPRTTIIGLHACADLSISAMLLFLAMPQVRCLHIMPCCYHKLALRCETEALADDSSARSSFMNFPLSQALREAMSADSAVSCFNRPFMRLACQQTHSRWRCDARAHAEHGSRMFVRALAEALCDADELTKVKRHDLDPTHQDGHTFADIQRRYQLRSRQTGQPLDWRSVHETRFAEITELYADGRGSRLAEALCCLQTSIQQLCENLVLYDRLCYLREVAAAQQLRLEVRYEKLFDEKVSPRCRVLIAEKL
ncbi:probable methyltransferase-like protein 25 isoform X2 [Drosophila montana]|uniref:probable methyltransferase-like protein 25 isoform X2 n=1 Tax=Drosophila montana TaxID=40370 RepID=UPI00313D8158